MRRSSSFILSALLAAAVRATGASATGPPITGTEVTSFSDSFSEPFFCGGELYAVTATGHMVVHFTFFEGLGRCGFTRSLWQGCICSRRRDGAYLRGELFE